MRCPLSKCQVRCNCGTHVLMWGAIILDLAIWWLHWNQPLFFTINAWHSLLPNQVWSIIGVIAYPRFFILPALLLLLTAIWRRDQFTDVLVLVAAYYIIFFVLKRAFNEARPYEVLQSGTFFLLSGGYENLVKAAHHSFPSGHAGVAAIFAFASMRLFFARHCGIKVVLFLVPIVVGISRICVGHHWPLDVLSGVIIAYLLVKCFLRNTILD